MYRPVNIVTAEQAPDPPPPARGRGRPPGGPEQSAATRERILRVATGLFATQGFHGTGVAEIGLHAGVQRGALYYHIGSKDELLFDVLRGHIDDVCAAAEAIAADPATPPVEKLTRLIHAHVRIIATQQEQVAIWIRDGNALGDARRAELQARRDRVEDAWRRIVEEGAAAGVFRTADHVTVNGLLGMVNMVYLWFRPDGPQTPEAIADRFTELVTDGLVVRGSRRRV